MSYMTFMVMYDLFLRMKGCNKIVAPGQAIVHSSEPEQLLTMN